MSVPYYTFYTYISGFSYENGDGIVYATNYTVSKSPYTPALARTNFNNKIYAWTAPEVTTTAATSSLGTWPSKPLLGEIDTLGSTVFVAVLALLVPLLVVVFAVYCGCVRPAMVAEEARYKEAAEGMIEAGWEEDDDEEWGEEGR